MDENLVWRAILYEDYIQIGASYSTNKNPNRVPDLLTKVLPKADSIGKRALARRSGNETNRAVVSASSDPLPRRCLRNLLYGGSEDNFQGFLARSDFKTPKYPPLGKCSMQYLSTECLNSFINLIDYKRTSALSIN